MKKIILLKITDVDDDKVFSTWDQCKKYIKKYMNRRKNHCKIKNIKILETNFMNRRKEKQYNYTCSYKTKDLDHFETIIAKEIELDIQ